MKLILPAMGGWLAVTAVLGQTEILAATQQTLETRYLLPAPARTFEVEYVGQVTGIPAGTKLLRVWMPVPQDSTVQKIRNLTLDRSPRLTIEPKYGNRIAYWEIQNPEGAVDLKMRFTCTRHEVRMNLEALDSDGKEAAGDFAVFKQADALVTLDEEIRKLASEITRGKSTSIEKARAIYDYVLEKMTYDKNHDGWGLGSTRHACEVGKGNCTDFHALFNSLCRAQGIASGFEIGLYLPYEKNSSEKLGGYHCWAFFRVPGKTWVPVDCSEADRYPQRKQFFFGGHTSNRVTLSTGRDLILNPTQQGPPLNYFLNPHAEADGKTVPCDKSWSYHDLN
ncbi:MAG: transglutaminase-like domain-containing protein [Verrucomicrobiota bacterium]